MSTHMGHVMPKRTMSKNMEKKRINKMILSVDSNLNMKFKVCIGDLTSSNVLI